MTSGSMPTLGAASFMCPHCGAMAHQYWYQLWSDAYDKDIKPRIPKPDEDIKVIEAADPSRVEEYTAWALCMNRGNVFVQRRKSAALLHEHVHNLWLSKCFSCDKFAVWVHDRLTFPIFQFEIAPNPDLPDDIKADFIEAAQVIDLSPRASAALLRLCVEKLCKHLGKTGRTINDDIKSLVSDGLNPRIQKALDTVRLIGNNAVHPGKMETGDDKQTASKLFRLVNMIADEMITRPKQVDELYATMPDTERAKIAKRDQAAQGQNVS